MERPASRLISSSITLALVLPALLAVAPALFMPEAGAVADPASPVIWLKHSGNPVLGPGTGGSFESRAVFSNSVVRSEGKYFLYYTGFSGTASKIGLATSTDGKTFSRYAANPIISNGENGSVLRDTGDFKMWYIGQDGICHATSADGRVWNPSLSNPVLANGQPPAWDADLRSVNVIRDGDVYKMWYSGGNGSDVRVGYATSPDGVIWTKYFMNPVLVQETSWESAEVRSPCVLRIFGEYHMWYTASDGRSSRICFASSADGTSWVKYSNNPLMPISAAWETANNLCPVVLSDGRDLRMWYTGTDSAFRAQVGYAESTGTGPFAPVLRAPADNTWTNASLPAFNWSFGSGGSGQSAYQLVIDDSLDFGSPQLDTGMFPSTDTFLALSEPLPDGTWYWRVKAMDPAGDVSGWSEVGTVKIDTAGPAITDIEINGGAAYTANQKVRLTLNATDPAPGCGISEMRYAKNGTGWYAWMPFWTELSLDLFGADRAWTVTVEVRDRVNNTSPGREATIVVDTMPPVATGLRINDGARYAGNRSVRLSILAGDPEPGTGVAEMAFSNDGVTWTPWEPFSAERAWNLSAGDGPKTVGVRLRDRAGNTGVQMNSSIIVDATPPVTSLLRSPAVTEEPAFTVSWTAQDSQSGVGGFDVEYRVNDGPWTAWLNATNLTSAAFTGADGNAYSFRARSFDNVGNIEPFPANVSMTVRVKVPQPVVVISDPVPQKILKGKHTFSGTSSHPKQGVAITLVEVSIDGGPWVTATGTLSWSYAFDTTKLKNGMHNITARSSDGAKYSDTAVTAFKVENEPASPALNVVPIIIVIALAVAAGAAASVLVLRGRKAPPARPADDLPGIIDQPDMAGPPETPEAPETPGRRDTAGPPETSDGPETPGTDPPEPPRTPPPS